VFMQPMISWLIRGSQVDSCIASLQTSAMSRACLMSYKLVWNPGDFTIYRVLMSAQRDFVDDILGDFPDDTWMIAVDRRC
jgi:hypothetical protein